MILPVPSLRPVGGLAGDLRAAVAVEIIDHELRVVRALADVHAEIDPPQQRAVELVGFEDRRLRSARCELSRPRAA